MDRESAGGEPQPHTDQPTDVKLPGDLVYKQQVLRRHLQDPASPAFNDPVRAAELAGFHLLGRSTADPGPEGLPSLFPSCLSITKAIHDATARKAATIEKLRRRVSEGMDAMKIVIVSDREGARFPMEVPDQAARRQWAQLSAQLENLLPRIGGNASSDTLPHDAAEAEELEIMAAESGVGHKVSRMCAADRYLVSQFLLKVEHHQDSIRRQVIAAKLGKSIREFEDEVEQEVNLEMMNVLSVLQNDIRNEEGEGND